MMGGVKRSRSDIVFDTINTIILFIVLFIVLYPLIFVLSASFSNPILVMQGKIRLLPKEPTLRAYKAVFRNDKILIGYKNTLMYTFMGTLINLIMTTMGAYPLSRKDFCGRQVFTLFFTITMFFSGGLIPTYLVIKTLGLYNSFWVMVLPGAVSVWNMFVMRAFFQNSIPTEIEEAARIDGCSNIGTLLKIIIPLSAPIFAVMTMRYGVSHWNSWFPALIYLKDESRHPLQFVLREILIQHRMDDMLADETAHEQRLIAEALKYAVIVVSSVPVLLLYPFLQKYFVKGVMIGAIKG